MYRPVQGTKKQNTKNSVEHNTFSVLNTVDLTGTEDSQVAVFPETDIVWKRVNQNIVDEDDDFEYSEEERVAFLDGKPPYSKFPLSSEGASTPGLVSSDV